MYIQRVVLENIRGFESLDFTFERPDGSYAGWTVLTGDNGSGKTALLKAIALALVGPDVGRALQPSLQGWIRSGEEKGYIGVQLVPDKGDGFKTGRPYESPFWSELLLETSGGPEVTLKPTDSRRRARKGPLHGPWAENTAGWFSVGYGPFRRLYGASPEAQRLMSGPNRVARFATMFKEDATLLEGEFWLKELDYRALEEKEREGRVLKETLRLLNDDFLRHGVRVDRVDSDGLWLRDQGGTVLPLADMSEGYRATLALMIDIMRHLDRAYPHGPLIEEQDDRLVVPYRGVVLIDEVDAHLHPEWQRTVGHWFKRRFPEMQFLVTSHSALVCQAADPGGIFHLPPPGSDEEPFQLAVMDYQAIRRAKADTILLSPAFGMTHTRSPAAVEGRQQHARLKAKEKAVGLDNSEGHQLLLLAQTWLEPEDEPDAYSTAEDSGTGVDETWLVPEDEPDA